MSITDELLSANKDYAAKFDLGGLAMPPARKIAILACMDARLSVEKLLGLKTGDAHIIRNAGGIATEDALRSLIISHQLLGTQEFIVFNHTDCGMLTFNENQLLEKLEEKTGATPSPPLTSIPSLISSATSVAKSPASSTTPSSPTSRSAASSTTSRSANSPKSTNIARACRSKTPDTQQIH